VREYWTIHPVDGLFAIWRPGPNGLYARPVYHGLDGEIPCPALPGVVIDPKLVFEIPEKQEPFNPPPRPE
jgi:Uma2 family endonuclease